MLGGNTFGLLAPIVTGYLVEATKSFNSAFIAAGALALIGADAALGLSRGPIGEVPRGGLTRATLANCTRRRRMLWPQLGTRPPSTL